MEDKKRRRCAYVTPRQKNKLIELVTKHPQLITCKLTQDFNYKDSQKLWQDIANECHSIPGARKTWKQWRKSWHDLRSKMKKKNAEMNGELPLSIVDVSPTEEDLSVKDMSSNEGYQDTIEFVMMDANQQASLNEDISGTISDPESPKEQKVFNNPDHKTKKVKMKNANKSGSKDSCYFNCDVLAVQEQRKIQIKEDYLIFKKDYLRQKLKLLKEQTEALKSIAKELCK